MTVQYSRILVPLDGSPLAEAILPHAEELARRFGAELLLLHVVPGFAQVARLMTPEGTIDTMNAPLDAELVQETVDANRSAGERYLDEVSRRYESGGPPVQTIIAEGPAAETILEVARAEGASLIAMSTHGKSGLARTVMGSVADEVMREGHLPVLLLRPREV